jgi:hypothetical protein
MGKRGPKPKFRPLPPVTPGGSWRVYIPGQGVVSLNTTDEKQAYAEAGKVGQSFVVKKPANTTAEPSPFPQGAPTAKDMLDTWIQSSPDSGQPSSPQPFTGPQPLQSPAVQSPTQSLVPSLSTSDKVDAVMGPEKRAKVAGMLAKGITLINVAGTAWCVKLLGTIPKLDDEDEAKDVLKIGWELQLEELFVNHPPQPWMVILGGTAALFTGMLLNGERIPKVDKKKPRPPEGAASKLDFDNESA